MAVTLTPVAVGGKISAAFINLLISVLTVAQAYVPTLANWASATTAPTTTGRYWITGNICHVLVQTKLGTGAITVGMVTLTLPVPMDTTGMITLSTVLNSEVGMTDVSATLYFAGNVQMIDANTVRVMRPSTTGNGQMGVTAAAQPFVWATLDEMSIAFSYPIA